MRNMDLLISLVAGVAIGLWIYGDAQDRKLKDGLFWAMIGLLFSFLGFIGYWLWVIRPDKRG
jgi:predicted PurR-regulated permease PerM